MTIKNKLDNIAEFTVSEFSRSMKRIVEDNFGYVRIKGEISGFKKASSGHLYFNLKDDRALINAVCFRNMAEIIDFEVAEGLEVVASGKVSIYEGRSNYQIIIEKLEIAGIGSILKAIEKRRIKLLEQGYFDVQHKKSLPFLPKNIGVITSPTGAVIEDIINRINARFPTLLTVYPSLMQGKNCSVQIIKAIKYFNQLKENQKNKPDLIIIARGGGSFEDLLPFNDEELVLAVFNSQIPIISAVGHETDTTLIDYVADLRVATPSAAAEIAVPVLKDLQVIIDNLNKRLTNYSVNFMQIKHQNLLNNSFILSNYGSKFIEIKRNKLLNLSVNLIHPKQRISSLQQKFVHLILLLNKSLSYHLKSKEQQFKNLTSQIYQPFGKYENWQNKIDFLSKNLQNHCQNLLQNYQNKQDNLYQLLSSYNYRNVLLRGYSLIRHKNKIISRREKIINNQIIDIEMFDGNFKAVVIDSENLKDNNPSKKNISDFYPSLFDLNLGIKS